jgi:ribosomal protein S18 acetylase RimI-like enzyme
MWSQPARVGSFSVSGERRKNQHMESLLTQDLTMRPATPDDRDLLYNLSHAYDLWQYGRDQYTREDVHTIFAGPNVDLEHDTCLVFEREGRLVGSLFLEAYQSARFLALIRLHPKYSDPRPGDFLLALAEKRARARMVQAAPAARVTLECWAPTTDLAALTRFEQAGFQQVRRHWRMEIALDREPASPVWPEHLDVRPFVPARDGYAVYRAMDAAFTDHWGHVSHTFEQWQHWSEQRADFDPGLWLIAWEGEQVVGGSLCVLAEQWGWVSTLGVIRAWRRRGLGMALLEHSFGEFYRRGLRRAGLDVDSQNLSGAVRLYHRAGMHVACETITCEKELRAGGAPSIQTFAL